MKRIRTALFLAVVCASHAFSQTKGFYLGLTASPDVYRHSAEHQNEPPWFPSQKFPVLLNGTAGLDVSYVGNHFFVTTKALYSTKRVVLDYGLNPRESSDPIAPDRTEATARTLSVPVYAGYVHRLGRFLLMPGIGVVFERKIGSGENQKSYLKTGGLDNSPVFTGTLVNPKATAVMGTFGIGYSVNRLLFKIEPTVRRYPHLVSNQVAGGTTGFHLPITVSVGL